MSRIGRAPIPVPDGVEVKIEGSDVSVKGPKGQLAASFSQEMQIVMEDDGTVQVRRPTDRGPHRALHGLTRTLIANMVEGVTRGFTRELEINGVGYRAQLKGKDLELLLGKSHPELVHPEPDTEFEVPKNTQIIVKGIDKQVVGQLAARIRALRPPEPYKGKGIKYVEEQIRRKVGKRA